MAILAGSCFEFDLTVGEEVRFWKFRYPSRGTVCTKYPGDEDIANFALPLDRSLHMVYMLRDPRDVVVSIHGMDERHYFCSLNRWLESLRWARKIWDHSRFTVIRYEDLVTDPDRVQQDLVAQMPFLEVAERFSAFQRRARVSKSWSLAMRGTRAITPQNVGAWRRHKPRLAAQLRRFGDISDLLIELGYECDRTWLEELTGLIPDDLHSLSDDNPPLPRRLISNARPCFRAMRYLSRRMASKSRIALP